MNGVSWRSTASLLTVALLAAAIVGCSEEKRSAEEGALQAEEIGGHDCVSCGMIVREQPAPRAQLVHRDGTRVFFCSIGDLLVYLDAPSSHGKPTAIFVEAMSPSHDPQSTDTKPRLWIDATAAIYVLGVDRPQIMGAPVLVYEKAADATDVAKRHGGDTLDWNALPDAWAKAQAARE